MSLAKDVENLFVPEVLAFDEPYGKPVPDESTKNEAHAALATLDPEHATRSPAEQEEVAESMGKLSVESDLKEHLTTGVLTPDVMNSLRDRYKAPDPDEAVVGAVKATAEPGEDLSHVSAAQLKSDRWYAKRDVAKAFMEGVGIEPTVTGIAVGVADAALRTFVAPTLDNDRLAGIIAQEFPELGPTAFANIGEAIDKVRENLFTPNMSLEQARSHMFNMSQGIEKAAALGYYSPGQSRDLHNMLFEAMASGEERTTLGMEASTLNTAGQVLERVGDIPLVGGFAKGVKPLVKGLSAAVNSVGLVKGTASFVAAQSKAGVEGLASLVRSRASSAPVPEVAGAAKTEDIIDSIAMPKMGDRPIDQVPYVPSALVHPKVRDELLQDPAYVFGAAPVKRINGAVAAEEVDGGIHMTATFGTANGAPYKNAKVAETANKRDFGGVGTVVPAPEGKGHFIRVEKSREYGLEEASKGGDLTQKGAALSNWVGKAIGATPEGITTSNVAVRASEKTSASLSRLVSDFEKAPAGSKRRVAAALDDGDLNNVVHPLTDLREKYHLNDQEIVMYAKVRRAHDIALDIENRRLFEQKTAEGWKGLNVNGQHQGVMPTDVEGAVRAMKGVPAREIEAVRPDGTLSHLGTVGDGEAVVRLMVPAKGGTRFAIVSTRDLEKLGPLPTNMLPNWAGKLKRSYKYPHYVKRVVNGKVEDTVRPARSALEAQQLVDELHAANPGEKFKAVPARELQVMDDTSEMEAMAEAGIVWSNKRGPSRLFDASGGVRMPTVEDRIRGMVDDAGLNAGLLRWGDAQKARWNKEYGSLFDNAYSPGLPIGRLSPKADADVAKIKKAKAEAEFINNALGAGRLQADGKVKALASDLAERLYNSATRLERAAVGKNRLHILGAGADKPTLKEKGVFMAGNLLRGTGDNLVGQSGRVIATAKTVPYLLHIAGHPLRQLPMQLSNIPSYFGIEGGLKYAAGGFQRDMSALLMHGLTEQGGKLAGKLGIDPELFSDFARSGTTDSLAHHTLAPTIGTVGKESSSTRLGRGIDEATQAAASVGVGLGLKGDKVAAWLLARNRAKIRNGGKPLSPRQLDEVASFAEEMALNPNTTDVLAFQHGALGIATQFLSMQVKQLARVAQAIPGVPTGSLTKAETMRMAGINLLTYGLRGYGLTSLANKALNHPDMEWMPEEGRELLSDGIANFMFDASLTAMTGEETHTAFSSTFSPNSHLGGSVNLVTGIADIVATGDWDTLANARWNAPVLGFTKQVVEALTFSAAVFGAPPLPTPESSHVKMATVAKKVATLLPAMNSWMKEEAGREYRAKMNSRGDPLVEASLGESLAALAGIPTRDEEAMWNMKEAIPSSVSKEGDPNLASVRDQAYKNSKWLLPLLDQYVDGKISYAESLGYIDTANVFFMTSLSPQYHAAYVRALRDMVDDRWSLKYDRMIQKVVDDAGTGKLPLTENAITTIGNLIPDPDKRKAVTTRLNTFLFGAQSAESP